MAADSGLLSVLVLLDLSATFDTISHSILLHRLSSIGIFHTPLTGFIIILLAALSSYNKVLWLLSISCHTRCAPGLCPGTPTLYYLPSSSRQYLQKILHKFSLLLG
ncbi:hypothetical protein XENORESO_016348 [Xenotaenia resolanae]|uniref:Reverse transcriptase domain-containing protein n=1 Tax=Xenotaenia resolanae TaxID=208358 RepID=A0ABV0VY17_9TELE